MAGLPSSLRYAVTSLAPRPRERERSRGAPTHRSTPSSPDGDSLLAQDKEIKEIKEFKELKESGAHRESDSHRKQRPLPPPQSPTPTLLKILKLLKLLKLLILNLLKSPAQACIVLRGGVPPPTPEAHLRRHQVGFRRGICRDTLVIP